MCLSDVPRFCNRGTKSKVDTRVEKEGGITSIPRRLQNNYLQFERREIPSFQVGMHSVQVSLTKEINTVSQRVCEELALSTPLHIILCIAQMNVQSSQSASPDRVRRHRATLSPVAT